MSHAPLTIFAVDGIAEIESGDDLCVLIGDAVDGRLEGGDILAITSKIVSKSEGRRVLAADREQAITDETVRIVASRAYPGGMTRIVENRQGFVMAAAGVDASNTPEGTVLLLPIDPDESARKIRKGLSDRFGLSLGIVITDTFGRPWREGQTDVAIGAAGVIVTSNLTGTVDAHGRPLHVTNAAIADEIAGAADLVKGKSSQCPVAVIRGLSEFVIESDGPGASALVREASRDMFHLGADEAYRAGFEQGNNERP